MQVNKMAKMETHQKFLAWKYDIEQHRDATLE